VNDQPIERSYFEIERIQSGAQAREEPLVDAHSWMEEVAQTKTVWQ
jgi:hypothetical protein